MKILATTSVDEQALRKQKKTDGFTLIECLVSAMIFIIAFGAVYMAHYQAIRQLDGLRQMSRAEDVTLANIEFLRTRNWDQLLAWTNISTTHSLRISTNMIETRTGGPITHCGVPYDSMQELIFNYLELDQDDPAHIFLTGDKIHPPRRTISMVFWPDGSAVTYNDTTHSMIKATVTTSWKVGEKWMTNSMTTIITKGGITATDI